ncbi:MAG: sigma 54-interacting transcriptional regulator, partial [Desulfohalobiaceae bacterium]
MSDSQFYDTQDQADKPRGIHMQDPIGRAHEEISRLSKNNQVLFDLLPDMLFIIKDNLVIERMNQAALERFGNQERGSCYQVIFGLQQPCAPEYCPFQAREGENPYGRIWEQKIHDNFFVEYSYVPFEGYQQDNLVLVVLKDVTKQKQHEQELERFNQNIEQVLKEKIQDLKQSEAERQQLYQELNYLKKEALPHTGQEEMLGDSMPIRELRETIYQVAPSDATVLITGESGTGKELVADMLYMQSHRVGKPYLKFNCAAVTESLLESELFGYEKGDFTGAKNTRKG